MDHNLLPQFQFEFEIFKFMKNLKSLQLIVLMKIQSRSESDNHKLKSSKHKSHQTFNLDTAILFIPTPKSYVTRSEVLEHGN